MADHFRVLSVMGRQLEELEISANAVLRLAGLPSELFQQSRIWLTTEDMRALYNAISEVSGDGAIGLKLGAEERPEYYSPIAIAALFTRSFRDALNRVARYKRLTSPQEIRMVERGNECAIEFVWLLDETTESPIWVDSCFAWTVTIGRRGIGRTIHPLRAELRRRDGAKQNTLAASILYLSLGERDESLRWLEKAMDASDFPANFGPISRGGSVCLGSGASAITGPGAMQVSGAHRYELGGYELRFGRSCLRAGACPTS